MLNNSAISLTEQEFILKEKRAIITKEAWKTRLIHDEDNLEDLQDALEYADEQACGPAVINLLKKGAQNNVPFIYDELDKLLTKFVDDNFEDHFTWSVNWDWEKR